MDLSRLGWSRCSVLGLSALLLAGGAAAAAEPAPVGRQTVGQEVRHFTGHSQSVSSVAISSDGRRIVTGSYDKTARLWDAATGEELLRLEGHIKNITSVAFSRDGRRVVTGSADKTARLWDAAGGQELLRLEGHTENVTSVAFSPDGRHVVTGSDDKTARLWDAATGKELLRFKGHTENVVAVAFSPNGRSVLTGSYDKTARLWDAATGKELSRFTGHVDGVCAVAFSADGRQVVTGGADRTARLWNVVSGKELQCFWGHAAAVCSVAISPDGQQVLTGSYDQTAQLWDRATGRELCRFEEHSDNVTSVAFSPDGRQVLTGSDDRTALLRSAAIPPPKAPLVGAVEPEATTRDTLAASPRDATPTGGMTERLDVDLQTDPRKNFQVVGPVQWQPGRLTLGPDGSIRRGLECGSQTKLDLRLAFTPLREDGQSSTTRFAFQFHDRGEFVVQIHRQRQAGKNVVQLQIIEKDTPFAGRRLTRTLRTDVWKGGFPEGLWTFRHEYGLLTVSYESKRLAVAYADKEPTHPLTYLIAENPASLTRRAFYIHFGVCDPLEVSGWSLGQQGLPVACAEVNGVASRPFSVRENLGDSSSFNQALARYASENAGEIYQSNSNNTLRQRISLPLDDDQMSIGQSENLEEHDPLVTHIRECLGDGHPYYALALAGVGMQYHWAGRDEVAKELLNAAIQISAKSLGPSHPDRALVASALGRLYREDGQSKLAEPLLAQASQAALDVFGSSGARYLLAQRDLALLYQDTGRMAEAETTLRQLAENCRSAPAGDRGDALPVLVALGELEARLGEREKAVAVLHQAQEAMEKLIYPDHGEFRRPSESAVDYEARRRLVKLLPVDLAKADVLLAWESFRAGKTNESRQMARTAYLILVQEIRPGSAQGLGDWGSLIQGVAPNGFLVYHPDYDRTLTALGELFAVLGDLYPAVSCVQMIDAMPGTHTHDLGVLCRIMALLCEAHPDLDVGGAGRSKRAELNEIYGELERHPRPGVRLPPRAVYWWQLALRTFEQSHGHDYPDTLDALQNVARLQWSTVGPEKAQAALRDAWGRAVDLSERVLSGLPEAQAYQFLEINRPPADMLLSCYRATNKDHARDAYEVVWRSKALATRLLVERHALVQAATGRPEIARLAEQLQTTRQQLAWLSLSAPASGGAESRRQQLVELTSRKEDIERQLAGQSEVFRRTRAAAQLGVGDLARRLQDGTAVVDIVERWLWTPPDPTPTSTAWSRTRRYDAFVLRPTKGELGCSVAWLELGDADALDRSLDAWIAGLRRQTPTDAPAADRLRRQLWEPIEAYLAGCKTVILIPDGRLAQVPWTALPGRPPHTYLLEDYALAQAPYGQYVARLLTDQEPKGEGFLLMGGVDYGPAGQWPNLGGTADEVERLARLWKGPQTLGGAAATKSRLRQMLPGRRYVHLATHGAFLDSGPAWNGCDLLRTDSASGVAALDVSVRNPLLRSMLVLAGANQPAETDVRGLPVGSDSFLTAEEVMGMDLAQTELVVLSACETGAGKVRTGEGVFSLQRAFHVSGSRTVVATLWSISDGLPTRVLMERFYSNLWNKKSKMGKLQALHEAQLWLLREGWNNPELRQQWAQPKPANEEGDKRTYKRLDRPDVLLVPGGKLPPYYWAGFVLSGDWR